MNKKCQVFTPENYVKELLDCIGYKSNLYGKKIMENSCGDGNILEEIVCRYINDCIKNGFDKASIRQGLMTDIYGVEIDAVQHSKCINRLNRILEEKNISSVEWNIYNDDYLKFNDRNKYRYIVGNPPYITYKEMDYDDRTFLYENFLSCKKGKFDYYYAFIEKSILSLDEQGKMAYLIPSSFFKNVFGLSLRNMVKKYVDKIVDFTQEKVFCNALVKSSILALSANNSNEYIEYKDVTLDKSFKISKTKLGEKWFFTQNDNLGSRKFGDYFNVSHSVATLCNEVFVLNLADCIEDENYYLYKEYAIEKAILRDAAAPKAKRYNVNEKIIFPYYYDDNGLRRYIENDFKKKFPGTYRYLLSLKQLLDNRKKDQNCNWFEYGRSQAIARLNTPKVLLSTVITTKVNTYLLESNCVPYSGMYITSKNNNLDFDLQKAISLLESREFMQYVFDVGTPISGNSLRITSKDIEEYRF